MALTPTRLRKVRTLSDVLEFLADDLDWPIGDNTFDDSTFDYTPEELGVPAEQVPKLRNLRQLRPLEQHQPWGIFFIEFDGPRLPLTPLRRLLQRLVATKRATKQHSTWALDDLLFVITTESADTVELHFVAFAEKEGHVAEILSLPWQPAHSPDRHLQRLAKELLPHLQWPANPDDEAAWRDEWRAAFKLRHGEVIGNAQRLAERMAEVAVVLRECIAGALRKEKKSGPFHTLMNEVRSELVADVDEARFADMCAQTLTYGTLSARVTDPVAFGASPTLTVVPLSNPFLSAFFDQVHDEVVELDLDDAGLEQLVADLRETNVEAILDDFGNTAKGGDPVVHFYEEFLRQYDPRGRIDAGAFYTPQPVVHFMVRAVDEVLRQQFGLADGLADDASWRDIADANGFEVPGEIDPDAPFIRMIDPATGTGTFLVEWLRRAKESFEQNHAAREWPARLREAVLPAMHAFELMLGPYAIAHLKVALETHDDPHDGADVAIYLTDTLEHPSTQGVLETMADPVAAEGERAAALKQQDQFTVCIGNPPYDREQKAQGASGRRKGGVVRYGAPDIEPLITDLLEPLRVEGQAAHHARSLYNDYIYFWRWATWQVVDRHHSPGIVAFITASSYLSGVSFGGLRQHLRDRFDELHILDLGGDSMGVKVLKDENVFDIRVPVAICIAVKRSTGGNTSCEVLYRRLGGSRGEKFAELAKMSLTSEGWVALDGSGTAPLRPHEDTDQTWAVLTELLPWSARGIQFSRTWPVAPSRSVVERRWTELLAHPRSQRAELLHESRDAQVAGDYRSFLSDRSLSNLASLRRDATPDGFRAINYRTFDIQWCIADRRVVDMPRPALWRIQSDKQLFLVTLAGPAFSEGPQCIATTLVPDLNSFNNRGGIAIPLWRDRRGREPNTSTRAQEAISSVLSRPITVRALAAYAYGLLGTGALASHLRMGGLPVTSPPAFPLTAQSELFEKICELGNDLLAIHTEPSDRAHDQFHCARQKKAVRGYPESFAYDLTSQELTVGTGRFGPVSKEVWAFEVSGLKVLQSWLGYRMATRKGRKSSPLDDIRPERWTFTDELLRVIAILQRTVDLTPRASELLAAVVSGPLIDAASLPTPTDAERKPPRD
jgi:hypothetical protein